MKGVFIKGIKGDKYDVKQIQKAAIKNAHRTIRQQTRQQLNSFCIYRDIESEFYHPYVAMINHD